MARPITETIEGAQVAIGQTLLIWSGRRTILALRPHSKNPDWRIAYFAEQSIGMTLDDTSTYELITGVEES